MKFDYIVVGSGVSGMTSAVILAREGHRVGLIEKSNEMAPVIRGFKRKGTYFDTGFHYTGGLGQGEILDLYFKYLGISDKIRKIPLRQDGFDLFRCLKPGFEFALPAGYERIRDSLVDAFPGEAKGVDHYLKEVRDTSNAFPFIGLKNGLALEQSLNNIHGPSLKEVLDSLIDDDLLKVTLAIHCLLHGSKPEEIPFGVHSCLIGQFYESAHRIEGGGLALTRAFGSVLRELGVEMICGRGVKRIEISSNMAVSGVILEDGEPLGCRGCISTIHPRALLNLIPAGVFRPAYRKRLERLEESDGAYLLYVAMKEPVKMLSGRNLLLSTVGDISGLNVKPRIEQRPLFIAATDDGAGYIVVCPAMVNETEPWRDSFTGRRPEAYKRFKSEIAESLMKHVVHSFPELEGEVIHVECATPLSMRDWAHTPLGGAYGVKHKKGQYNPMSVTKAAGLFLAGQAVAAPGVIGAVISAFLACGHVVGHDRIQNAILESE